jgi:hypothetical protein
MAGLLAVPAVALAVAPSRAEAQSSRHTPTTGRLLVTLKAPPAGQAQASACLLYTLTLPTTSRV